MASNRRLLLDALLAIAKRGGKVHVRKDDICDTGLFVSVELSDGDRVEQRFYVHPKGHADVDLKGFLARWGREP